MPGVTGGQAVDQAERVGPEPLTGLCQDPGAGNPSHREAGTVSDVQQGPDWWQASDGRWYAPELHPSNRPPPPPPPPLYAPPPPPPPGFGYQSPWAAYPVQPSRATNGMAIASLVLGILWLYWLGSILALIFGYIARRQIRQRNEAGDGIALAGIVLGWVGVGVGVVVLTVALILANSNGS